MMSSSWSTMALLISRGLGRSLPAGVEIPSSYSAGASRARLLPALPHSGLFLLLPVPSMLWLDTGAWLKRPKGSTANSVRDSNDSTRSLVGLNMVYLQKHTNGTAPLEGESPGVPAEAQIRARSCARRRIGPNSPRAASGRRARSMRQIQTCGRSDSGTGRAQGLSSHRHTCGWHDGGGPPRSRRRCVSQRDEGPRRQKTLLFHNARNSCGPWPD